MRHGRRFRKLGRDSAHRRALLRNLTTQLLKYERIETTLAKAKELRGPAEKMITLAKRDTEASRRQAQGWIMEPAVLPKLFGEMATRYANRPGGYTRVLKTGIRQNDSAQMAVIEFVDNPFPPLRPALGPGPRRKSVATATATATGLDREQLEALADNIVTAAATDDKATSQ